MDPEYPRGWIICKRRVLTIVRRTIRQAVEAVTHALVWFLASWAKVLSWRRALCKRVGVLDHLFYTAGDELLLSPVAGIDLAAARRAFEVRVFGALGAVKHAAAAIRPGGSIVLTHGIAGARAQAGWAIGAAVCGAMEAMTRALAVELAPVRVNAVSPGLVRTPQWNPIPEPDREALFREGGAKLLTKRFGEAGEIAEAYCYLMENTFTTGQTLVDSRHGSERQAEVLAKPSPKRAVCPGIALGTSCGSWLGDRRPHSGPCLSRVPWPEPRTSARIRWGVAKTTNHRYARTRDAYAR